jgi:hypothetical protein
MPAKQRLALVRRVTRWTNLFGLVRSGKEWYIEYHVPRRAYLRPSVERYRGHEDRHRPYRLHPAGMLRTEDGQFFQFARSKT